VTPKARSLAAPLALTSAGEVLINVAASAGPLDPQKLVERAVAEGGQVFVGVVLAPREVASALRALDDATAEMASWIFGGRHRRRRQGTRGRARK
jgi:hypothetical protein